jgi:hypothetical protein
MVTQFIIAPAAAFSHAPACITGRVAVILRQRRSTTPIPTPSPTPHPTPPHPTPCLPGSCHPLRSQIPDVPLPSSMPTLFSLSTPSPLAFMDLPSPLSQWPLQQQLLSLDARVSLPAARPSPHRHSPPPSLPRAADAQVQKELLAPLVALDDVSLEMCAHTRISHRCLSHTSNTV